MARDIALLARRRARKKPEKAAASAWKMQHLYRHLIRVAQDSLDQTHHVLSLLSAHALNLKALALISTLEQFLPLLQRVVDQATRRVLKGQAVPAADKVVSLFEPHTAIIQRGKAPPHETEFGRKVWYAEVDGGLISEYRLLPGNPPDYQDQWATSLKQHRDRWGWGAGSQAWLSLQG